MPFGVSQDALSNNSSSIEALPAQLGVKPLPFNSKYHTAAAVANMDKGIAIRRLPLHSVHDIEAGGAPRKLVHELAIKCTQLLRRMGCMQST
jgi:hypothetical protein